MNPLLSVYENLAHSANMRLPKDLHHNEKLRVVNSVIADLGLDARRDVAVGDLGGRSALSGTNIITTVVTKMVIQEDSESVFQLVLN